jgi:superfamily I DNA/RNA helicase
VIHGDQDAALTADARARIERWRRLRAQWLESMHALPFEEFARSVWRDGLAREGPPGSARARAQQLVLQRLMARLRAFLAQNPDATIVDTLAYAEKRMRSDLETCEDDVTSAFVRLSSVEAAHGLEFDRVVVAGARAGTFPLWYAPDAFMFSPRLGMIPKENVGEARASRTAKFTYYVFRGKTRERYNAQERRAFVYALSRARKSVLVTAAGKPTKGKTAPEFLEELG